MSRSLTFSKYHGTGNDFILIDQRRGEFTNPTAAQVAALCDRRFGIGADGIIVLAEHSKFDFEMINYNADGSLSSFCGNGARALIRFAFDECGIQKNEYQFLAADGEHQACISDGLIHLKMANVTEVKTTAHGKFLNTGSPHLVCVRENIAELDVKAEGARLRYHTDFAPKGTNVNFIERTNNAIRTYERGVEDETLSCGTGVIAAALVYEPRTPGQYEKEFQTRGGVLKVKFTQNSDHQFENIWLIGPAVKTFDGQTHIR